MTDEGARIDDRRWARWITFLLVGPPALFALPNFLRCAAHAGTDSEVGVMMYGFPLLIGTAYGCPVIGLFTVLWGRGLLRAWRRGAAIPRREMWCFGVIATGTAFLLLALSSTYLHLIRHHLGL